MAKYVINGGNTLQGTVTISGAKNAAVAILPAAILVDGVCRVENVPDISDVRIILTILEDLGAKIRSRLDSVLGISAKVRLVEPGTIARSEGKAKRVIDKRLLS